ncbi:Nef-associated protein, partial [Emiliania huxleyi CCMP1516]|uniref:TsaA-like domain-containing protein n=2 Tax=Emiliania huxleyi TaxID=2903 RepID=A0A0D3J6A1_EMIH1
KSKVRPPRLDGAKTGLYSTRTPHRPNRVGLSLVRLLAGDTLHLSGVDLCDGTAVVDVKPYVPFAD